MCYTLDIYFPCQDEYKAHMPRLNASMLSFKSIMTVIDRYKGLLGMSE